MSKQEEKDALLEKWVEHKSEENKAKEKRQAVEDEIVKIFKVPKSRKSVKFKEELYDVEVKTNEKIEVDQKEADFLYDLHGQAAPFNKKYTLNSTMYNSLKKISGSFYKRCSETVTFTPGRSSVKVTKKEEEKK